MVPIIFEEGFAGRVAESEVEVDSIESAQWCQHQQLKDEESRVCRQVVAKVGESVAVAASEHHRPDRKNDEVLYEIEDELEH